MADGLIWRLFYELSIRKRTTGEPANESVVQKAREIEIPAALDYLETQLPAEGFVFGALSIADISIACYFRTAAFVRYSIDDTGWPHTAALVARTQNLPVFQKLAQYEDCTLRVPLNEQRAALIAAGAPLTKNTLGTGSVRRVERRTT